MSRKRKKDVSSSLSSYSDLSLSTESNSVSNSLDDYAKKLQDSKHSSSDSDFEEHQAKKKTRSASKKSPKRKVEEKPKQKTKTKPKPKPKTATTTKKKRQVTKKYTVQEGKPLIKNLFKTKNRPFSATNIVDNLESKITIPTVKKVIVELLKESFITEQSWKKAKIWYVNQANMKIPNQSVVENMDEEIKTMKEKKQKLLLQNKTLTKDYQRLNGMTALSSIKTQIQELGEFINSKTSKLDKLKESIEISPQESQKLNTEYDLYRKEWKKRKKIVGDLFSQISEGSGKSLKQLFEDAEIETDEEVGKLFSNTDIDSIKMELGKKLISQEN
ncbi:tbp-1 interacting protein [Anaeramoeba flamelloides]|uniref:Homologous-pairing protein 2 homolog n=1 Tax=Anaeramoeba flamelloides TaxID=1746091 RepID=A0ABQ8XT23_9EUKA|nr:tbp-1 interacting protein [Anaeramoeba flamelloides]